MKLTYKKSQNKLARARIKDKISSKTLLNNLNMMSVNQLNALIKLLEIWKAKINACDRLNE